MGTNYYAITKESEKIHIGLSNNGWQFLFDHNDWKYFDKSKVAIEQFLSECNIVDEYGEKMDYLDFWNMVEYKSGGINNEQYYKNWKKYHGLCPEVLWGAFRTATNNY